MNIVVQGLNIFKIESFFSASPNKPYPGAVLLENFPSEKDVNNSLQSKANLTFSRYFEELHHGQKTTDQKNLMDSFELGHALQLPLDQKYKLISLENENARLSLLIKQMIILYAVLKSEKALEQRFILN